MLHNALQDYSLEITGSIIMVSLFNLLLNVVYLYLLHPLVTCLPQCNCSPLCVILSSLHCVPESPLSLTSTPHFMLQQILLQK